MKTNKEYETLGPWETIKNTGSQHYKTGSVEPIDLMRDMKPHESLTVLQIKALADCIKYATRMLMRGVKVDDCQKIAHYVSMAEWGVLQNSESKCACGAQHSITQVQCHICGRLT